MAALRSFVFSALALAHAVSGLRGVDQAILQLEQARSPLLGYPTDFTQNTVPKAIHSHNDYWRDVPLLTALRYGVASVEADVWLVNGTLHVGHERAALTDARTFAALYVDPLRTILDGQNPRSKFAVNQTAPNGVFDMAGGVSLHLLVDIKTDGVEALPHILEQLEPLRSRGYLMTALANGTLVPSAVTVIGTGNSPLPQVLALSPRDYFFDAPLAQLANTSVLGAWNASVAPIASVDYAAVVAWDGVGSISAAAQANITRLVADAHARGLQARFWDTPGWPIAARDAVWRTLRASGADWLNADDLAAAAAF